MLIQVKTLTGRKINLDLKEDNLIKDIKMELMEKEGIDVAQIRLICKGKQLNDTMRIDTEINSGDIIHMVLSLRGG